MEICIGTANFFTSYGVRNKKLINQEKVLDCAIYNGVDCIDYSFSYGSISSILIEKIIINNLKIHLKVSISKYFNQSKFIESILFLKNKLNENNIVSLSIHDPWYINENNLITLRNTFKFLKKEMPKLKIGISVYSKKDFIFLKKLECIEIIQLAYNPLQKKIFEYFVNEINTEKRFKLQIRSIFMQGLLLANDIQKYNINDSLKEYHKKWIRFVESTIYSANSICIDFAKKSNADQIIVGIDSQIQFEEFLAIFKRTTNINVPNFITPENINDARYWTK
jgi:aryl-alcohol dehydrogenase-like predicted oxidoreductase